MFPASLWRARPCDSSEHHNITIDFYVTALSGGAGPLGVLKSQNGRSGIDVTVREKQLSAASPSPSFQALFASSVTALGVTFPRPSDVCELSADALIPPPL